MSVIPVASPQVPAPAGAPLAAGVAPAAPAPVEQMRPRPLDADELAVFEDEYDWDNLRIHCVPPWADES